MTKNNISDKQLTKIIYALRAGFIIMLLIGLTVFTLFGVIEYYNSILPDSYRTTTGQITRAEIVRFSGSRIRNDQNVAIAIVEFRVNDNSYEFRSRVNRNSSDYPGGTIIDYPSGPSVRVGYNPDNPNHLPVNIDELPARRRIALLMGGIGIAMMALSSCLLYASRKVTAAIKIPHP